VGGICEFTGETVGWWGCDTHHSGDNEGMRERRKRGSRGKERKKGKGLVLGKEESEDGMCERRKERGSKKKARKRKGKGQ
jgi:hypothetical protein